MIFNNQFKKNFSEKIDNDNKQIKMNQMIKVLI